MTVYSENRRAGFDYEVIETLEAGMELFGTETKSTRAGRANITGAYVVIRGNEAWLLGADIPAWQPKNAPERYDPKRTRRLLLKADEIKRLIGKNQEKSLTLVPLKIYNKNQLLKLAIGICRPRRKADKREKLKKEEAKREIKKISGM